ncbi:Fe-S oxidoreductase [Actinoplanes sp. SE50]|uniref:FxsB family cyclophane-forming radical SAM/SPASM peptide maturase n=1 Tax=Actinoplanes sp. (strain ATCC 31044 / CBS 674.73 / SE50/110) TaxID=134676 RepID=UPI00023EBEA5|nr:FxsB family cyclophane-forming radical SAM/SPASM peptide maturase [Actinoplanes sp. SE50/110]AEV82391.1 AslB-like anaerobic sulfatase-maturating enzyme [Actinoplanes sp. SE50/110]ATO80788.1 Fe-S oxidoreductase [Actinoplanes sp. SE50]SLL98196.1 radical SAM protein [Actinoplanes sp. SE50/110]
MRQVLLKIHSRCNLACDYCYVYQHVDQSWRDRPRVMSRADIDLAVARIAEHAGKHDLPYLAVILHGGEPLLAGPDVIDYIVRAVRGAITSHTKVAFGVQTNGLLLDDAYLELFATHRIRVGVSLDGPATANDRHRRFPNGRGSHAGVARALRRLNEARHRPLFGGILCTVDVTNDPLDVYHHLLAFDPPELDFLLPHGNWDRPPPERGPDPGRTPYADWLIPIFDRWYESPAPQTRVRLFESLVSLLLGGPGGIEGLGLGRVDLVTVETDGTLEQGDALKTAAPGAPATGLHVRWHSFDDYLEHPGARARQSGVDGLSATCRRCPLVEVCGGGLYAHRYSSLTGFDNPSVYCADLATLIRHAADRLATDLPPAAGGPGVRS